jgi:hypothetical protein
MRWRKRFLHRRLVFIRETFDGSRDFAEATGAGRIAHFASAHAGFDQATHDCRDRARARAHNFFACVTLRESKAITDRAVVAFRFRCDQFAHIIDRKARSTIAVIDDFTIRIGTEPISFAFHAIEMLVSDVMKYRLTFDRPAFSSALDTLKRRALVG